MKYQSITLNMEPDGLVRHEMLDDRDHLVVPMVMLTEGVHSGSGGPLFYPGQELGRGPSLWDHKPIVVYHPTSNGQSISACDPTVINTRRCGIILNTTYDSKLRSEAWLDVLKTNKVDDRIIPRIEKREMIEVSTGLFTDNERAPGEWNGERYNFIARNYRPDHLAILPDQIGACSILDGAGLLQTNALSHRDKRSALHTLLRAAAGEKAEAWIDEVYDDFFVFYHNDGLFKQDYRVSSEDMVELMGTPVRVFRVTDYKPVVAVNTGNTTSGDKEDPQAEADASTTNSGDYSHATKKKGKKMKKEDMVSNLISSAATRWGEDDRTFLMGLSEDQLGKFTPVANKGDIQKVDPEANPQAVAEAAQQGATGLKPGVGDPGTPNAATQNSGKPQTLEQYLAGVPEEFRQVINSGLLTINAEKERLVAAIKTNAKNPYTDEALKAKPVEELRGLADAFGVGQTQNSGVTPSYVGAFAPTPAQLAGLLNNAAVTETPMPLPTMNFGQQQPAATK